MKKGIVWLAALLVIASCCGYPLCARAAVPNSIPWNQ